MGRARESGRGGVPAGPRPRIGARSSGPRRFRSVRERRLQAGRRGSGNALGRHAGVHFRNCGVCGRPLAGNRSAVRLAVANVVARPPQRPTRPAFVGIVVTLWLKTSKPVRCGSPTLGRFDSGAAPLSRLRRSDGPRGAFRPLDVGATAGRSRPPGAASRGGGLWRDCGTVASGSSLSRSGESTLVQVSVLGREQFPVPLGDDFDGAVDHLDGGLIVDRVRRH